ncbi:hypothetical protein [Pedobacter punctiformis]|uniref:FAS1 domain-containing protein n=1 Tax=Pedobacter punctiformis TaxID=3004097 RepID=A0ABT4LA97_9SPHI|nr:hypothetical protein [Pedobacter sp. HCMS5-2]MCZ4244857.1 hypothetical protein [Pedobacter sp. HCMS5-2]
MKNKINKLLFSPLVMLFVFCLGITACKKDSAYHDYENTIKEFDGTALKYLQDQKNTYDSMLFVLDRVPDLKDSLANDKLTLFAVTNQSFQVAIKNLNIERKAQNKTPMYLKDANVAQLDTLLSRYMVKGIRSTEDYKPFTDGVTLKSMKYNYQMHVQYKKLDASGFVEGGPQSIIYSDPKNSIFQKYWENATTNAVNIKTKNAIINVLAPSHDFGFNEFVKRINQ